MTELTDQMRTCAARIRTVCGPEDVVYNDAAALLLSAASEIELLSGPIDLGEPMEIIPPVTVVPPTVTAPTTLTGAWVDSNSALPVANPYRSSNTCPQCDSRSAKTVHREGKRFVLECSACGHKWWKR